MNPLLQLLQMLMEQSQRAGRFPFPGLNTQFGTLPDWWPKPGPNLFEDILNPQPQPNPLEALLQNQRQPMNQAPTQPQRPNFTALETPPIIRTPEPNFAPVDP